MTENQDEQNTSPSGINQVKRQHRHDQTNTNEEEAGQQGRIGMCRQGQHISKEGRQVEAEEYNGVVVLRKLGDRVAPQQQTRVDEECEYKVRTGQSYIMSPTPIPSQPRRMQSLPGRGRSCNPSEQGGVNYRRCGENCRCNSVIGGE